MVLVSWYVARQRGKERKRMEQGLQFHVFTLLFSHPCILLYDVILLSYLLLDPFCKSSPSESWQVDGSDLWLLLHCTEKQNVHKLGVKFSSSVLQYRFALVSVSIVDSMLLSLMSLIASKCLKLNCPDIESLTFFIYALQCTFICTY